MSSARCPQCGRELRDANAHCLACRSPRRARKTSAASSPRALLWLAALGLVIGGTAYFVVPTLLAPKPTSTAPAPPPADVPGIKARAEKGEAAGQYELGRLHATGEGVRWDYKEAARYYQLAADQAYALAQLALGELYEAGQGVPRDDAEAAKWYRKAADQGLPAGQYALAVLYLVGRGVPKDDSEALKLYRQSADQGYALALFHLGMRYKKGQGVPLDNTEAYKWLTLAANGGIAEATEIRDEIKQAMTREQIAEGKRRAESFVPSPTATGK